MKEKDNLLKLLFFYSNNYISSDSLGKKLGISQKKVYRLIEELRNEGYNIHACKNRGFSLYDLNDTLSPSELSKYYPVSLDKIRVFSSLPSTNSTAKEMAIYGAPEGTVVLAEKQSKGHGRFERFFFSPADSGLYMSIILRPNLSPSECLLITTLAAVAVAETAEILTSHPAKIKWVNDIFFKEKKIAGILAESAFTPDGQKIDYVILGIGLNIYPPKDGFPKSLQNVAGSLFEAPVPHGRCRVASCILNRFFSYYPHINNKLFLDSYKKRSFLTGKTIEIQKSNQTYAAKVLDIEDDFSLRIKLPNGEIKNLSSGEVSIKI